VERIGRETSLDDQSYIVSKHRRDRSLTGIDDVGVDEADYTSGVRALW